jgi:hypothetical protein
MVAFSSLKSLSRFSWCCRRSCYRGAQSDDLRRVSVGDVASFENNVLDLWFEGSHHADPHEHGAEAKSKGMTNRDQVMAVMQALQQQAFSCNGGRRDHSEINDPPGGHGHIHRQTLSRLVTSTSCQKHFPRAISWPICPAFHPNEEFD